MLLKTFAFWVGGGAAPATITFDNRIGYAASSTTFTDHAVGNINIGATANYVLVKTTTEGTATFAGVTVGGEALSPIAAATTANGTRRIGFWGLANPTTGSGKAVVASLSGNEHLTAEVVTLIGVNVSNPIAAANVGTASASQVCTLAGSLTPDGICWLEVGMCHGRTVASATYDSPITTNTERNASEHSGVYGFQADVVSSVTPQATWASGNEVSAMGAVLLRAA